MQTMDSNDGAGVCTQWVLAISVGWKFKTEGYRFREMLLPQIDAALSVGTVAAATVAQHLQLVYWEAGSWKKAEMLQVQVTEKTKLLLGEEHADSLTSMANLAATYRNQGQLEDTKRIKSWQ